MGETEVLELKKELRESQEKLCEQRHKTIDETLKKLEDSVQKLLWWLIGTMGGVLTTLIVLLIKK
jgi:uncharacterized membrane protein (DUF106 family)